MIHEDPDDLGYWVGDKPNPWGIATELTNLARILPKDEQDAIEIAAVNSEAGYERAAEEFRAAADYDDLANREDADG